MIAKLVRYNNKEDYLKDKNGQEEFHKGITRAVNYARKEVSKYRGTFSFVGFKVYNKYGDLKYKLPSY